MFKPTAAFSGFSVDDLDKAKAFYSQTLGLQVSEEGPGLTLKLPGGGAVFVYSKPDHQPATFTILNLQVANIDDAVDELTRRSVQFEQYHSDQGPQTDAKGIVRTGAGPGRGPNIAWFKDPAGNFLSVIQNEG